MSNVTLIITQAPQDTEHQDPGAGRGGRDAQQGLQGADLRRVPVFAAADAGGAY